MNLSIKRKIDNSNIINSIKSSRGSISNPINGGTKIILILIMISISVFTASELNWSALGIALGIIHFVISITAFFSWYKYATSNEANRFLEILTLSSLTLLALLYIKFIIICLIYKGVTKWLNLNHLNRNMDVVLTLFFPLSLSILFVVYSTWYYSEQPMYAKLCYIVALIVFDVTKLIIVRLAVLGKEKAYIRYKIKQELKYIGEFFVAIFLLIRQFYSQKDIELLLSVFVLISSYSAIKTIIGKFKENSKRTACFYRILSDLENCDFCLSFINPDTKLNIRFKFDLSLLNYYYDPLKDKNRNAIKSIYTLFYLGEENTSSSDAAVAKELIHCPYTYSITASKLRSRIESALNEIVKVLTYF